MAGDTIEYREGGVRVRVEGLNRVVRKLNQAGADAQDMRGLMHSIGMIVVNAAAPPRRSGRLAGDIRAGKGKTKAVVRAGGARVPYAGVRHYGWPARGIHAAPFLTDALSAKHAEIYSALENGIDDLLARNGLK